jgi:RimJ/RimL family protein N-acetyltransferase
MLGFGYWAVEAKDRPGMIGHVGFAGNLASIRLAEKAGFGVREDAAYKGAPILLFRRRR